MTQDIGKFYYNQLMVDTFIDNNIVCSPTRIAEKTGIHKAQISAYLKKVKRLTATRWLTIAAAYNITTPPVTTNVDNYKRAVKMRRIWAVKAGKSEVYLLRQENKRLREVIEQMRSNGRPQSNVTLTYKII